MTVETGNLVLEWYRDLIRFKEDASLDLPLTHELIPRSDLNAARTVARRFESQVTYGTQSGLWRMWNGRVHEALPGGDVPRLIHSLADVMAAAMNVVKADYQARANAAATPADADEVMAGYYKAWDKHRKYRDRLFSDAGQNAVLSMLKDLCGVDESRFDAAHELMVFENGVIDMGMVMEKGEVVLMPHDPSRLVTMMSDASYDPAAKCPWFDWYLARSLPDPGVRRYLQRWCGAALLGDPRDKGIINLIGPSDSGKSVFLRVLRDIGGGNARAVRATTFLSKGKNDQGFDLHELKGVRIVCASEPGVGKRVDDEVVKLLTGDDEIQSRGIFGKPVYWTPRCTIFFASNNPMSFDTSDEALLGRMKPIRFPVHFSRRADAPAALKYEPKLKDYLRAELPGILNWFMQGLLDYRGDGVGAEPESVASDREVIAKEIDNPLEWLQEQLDAGRYVEEAELPRNRYAQVQEAYHDYTMWCGMNGERNVYGRKRFSGVVQRRYPAVISGGARFSGLRKAI